MADRDPVHQPSTGKGELVFGAKSWKVPLLPYEKQLISVLGCSEEEYRFFVDEVRRRGDTRPAEYAHIPDARMEAATIIAIVSLVIGLASTAVSYVLAPKPKPFDLSRGGTPRQRQRQSGGAAAVGAANITGADRFAPTYGFDTQAELATYGEPIPLVFCRYDETNNTGGVLHSPKLVWSRAFSHGTQQSVKMMFVVGEQGTNQGQLPRGIAAPAVNGIFLGNGALDAIYSSDFAFYWKRQNVQVSRIRASNLLYGTRATDASGDPEVFDDVFSCPTAISIADTGFSSAHSLSNNAEFGCYAPVPNGTPFRLPWRVISRPRSKDQDGNFKDLNEDDRDLIQTRERNKIAGNDRMSGTGRNYSRRMGVISYENIEVLEQVGKQEIPVTVGGQIRFKISSNDMSKDFYDRGDNKDVTVDDINSIADEQRIAADEALQVGELFMIRDTVWQVVKRRFAVWTPQLKKDQIIRLKCVEIIGSNQIGVVANEMTSKAVLNDEGKEDTILHANTTFYPLMRVSLGMVRNTRPCEVTEIGLRSRVFQRLNGLTNFQSLPTPGRLNGADNTRVSLNAGQINAFARRASAFVIYVRPAGQDENGNPYPWSVIKQAFVVIGNNPTEQYNYIRFSHPEKRQYEYRFVPKNGADIRNSSSETVFWRLSATTQPEQEDDEHILSADFKTDYGIFNVTTEGKRVLKNDIRWNLEFVRGGELLSGASNAGYPTALGINSYIPDVDSGISAATAVERIEAYVQPSTVNEGVNAAFAYEIFGAATSSSPNTRYGEYRYDLPQGQWITLKYRVTKLTLHAGHYSGQAYRWLIDQREVVGSSGGFNSLQEILTALPVNTGNPFRSPASGSMTTAGEYLRVTAVTNGGTNRGLIRQAALEEILGPARSYPVGYVLNKDITIGSGNKVINAVCTAVVAANNLAGTDRTWDPLSVRFEPTKINTTTNWLPGDTEAITTNVSAGNPFYPQGETVGIDFIVLGIENVYQEVTELSGGLVFENHSQYSDLTYYVGQVEKSNANSPEHAITYVNEMVSNAEVPNYDAMTICGLSLKASRNFNKLDQLRVWLSEGLHVTRFHPDDGNTPGASNLFCDLVYYLLTDPIAGLGSVLKVNSSNVNQIINTSDFARTARFLKTNRLFYDGVIGESLNVRQFISEMAPNFLCNFVISDGKFSLVPAVPTTSSGEISVSPVTIKQLFTSGNIIEDSFEVEYLSTEERKPFQAVVRFREERKNQLPQERNIVVRWATDTDYVPVESFDVTDFCTNQNHAELLGRFYLSVRRRVTHTIRFATLPYGLDLAPGDYIKVVTQASPYSSARNGIISATGAITSVTPLADGQYNVIYYKAENGDVFDGTITVVNNAVTDPAFFSTIFTVLESSTSENVYMVEQLTLTEDNLVQIAASEFPCDSSLSSLLAQDLISQNRSRFVIEG